MAPKVGGYQEPLPNVWLREVALLWQPGGYRTRYGNGGMVTSRAPACVPETPLMSAVRAYIKSELNP